jgi:hypothetical protein
MPSPAAELSDATQSPTPSGVTPLDILQRGFMVLDKPFPKALGKALRKTFKRIGLPLPSDAHVAQALKAPGVTAGIAEEIQINARAFATALAEKYDFGVQGRHAISIIHKSVSKTVAQVYGTGQRPRSARKKRTARFSPELEAIGAPQLGQALIFDTETVFSDVGQKCRFGAYQLRGLTVPEIVKLDRAHVAGRTLSDEQKKWVREQLDTLKEAGLFFDPRRTTDEEQKLLRQYAAAHNLNSLTRDQFIDLLARVQKNEMSQEERDAGYNDDQRPLALIVGHNLPFDLGALTERFGTPRASNPSTTGKFNWRGGFWLQLCACDTDHVRDKHDCGYHPLVQILKLGGGKHAIKSRAGGRGRKGFHRNSAFLDTMTLGKVLLEGPGNLDAMARNAGVATPKIQHNILRGDPLATDDIAYCVGDVTTTWQLLQKLREKYQRYGLDKPMHKIYSPASLGKAVFAQMNIPQFMKQHAALSRDPAVLVSPAMASYYGGRSEVRYRCQPVDVIGCDFQANYSAVNALMRLQELLIAERITIDRNMQRAHDLLTAIALADLQRKEMWPSLRGFVKIKPTKDLLPARAIYSAQSEAPNIADNVVTSKTPLWYALADVIASVTRTGRVPKILDAIFLDPVGIAQGLKPYDFCGDPRFHINPAKDDIFTKIIDFRGEVKARMKELKTALEKAGLDPADDSEYAYLDGLQLALKLVASATSYGVTLELNADRFETAYPASFYHTDRVARLSTDYVEVPGQYFAPPIGALITAGSRLLLAIAEQLGLDRGISHAFCDTDSMAYRKPDEMTRNEFVSHVRAITDWFQVLSPYRDGRFFNIEHGETEPVRCVAVSAKRYALYTLAPHSGSTRREHVKLVKATQHGLGHIHIPREVYDPICKDRPRGRVEPWQQDLWIEAIVAFENGDSHPRIALSGLDIPLRVQITISTATWMKTMAPRFVPGGWDGLTQREVFDQTRCRPFSFWVDYGKVPDEEIGNMHGLPDAEKRVLRKSGCYGFWHKHMMLEEEAAAIRRYDTGEPLHTEKTLVTDLVTGKRRRAKLRTVNDAVAEHFRHPESKFQNPHGRGALERRHVLAVGVNAIGKESHRLTEQEPEAGHLLETGAALGLFEIDDNAVTHITLANLGPLLAAAVAAFGEVKVATQCGVSLRSMRSAMETTAREPTFTKLANGLRALFGVQGAATGSGSVKDEIRTAQERFGLDRIVAASEGKVTRTALDDVLAASVNLLFSDDWRNPLNDFDYRAFVQAVRKLERQVGGNRAAQRERLAKAREARNGPEVKARELAQVRERARKFDKRDLLKAAGSNCHDDAAYQAISRFLAGNRPSGRVFLDVIMPALRLCEAVAVPAVARTTAARQPNHRSPRHT